MVYEYDKKKKTSWKKSILRIWNTLSWMTLNKVDVSIAYNLCSWKMYATSTYVYVDLYITKIISKHFSKAVL